ncbi:MULTISPECIES: NADP-dependent phosphogluconate dehydrogenase [Halococcus]|uniref:6-phosphogluconate dehydrogenase-like protein n=1 Tax=Halococcus salifodinae DSM 8989 TaxID=1227456 RepID=M0NEP0_9EURY|nr:MULTISPECIES: NADP-dependent phosphogluconate dehydrogenase [Halococcus]EMA55539.1 6-phosphogluconate dehydrogenase-like protein [Halococcus salifodinae DSM 8989]
MSGDNRELAIVGLGKIGGNLARQAIGKDIRVVGFDTADRPDLDDTGVEVHDAGEYDTLVEELDPPRVIYLSLPAGGLIDDELDALLDHLDEGDVVMDGGNSFWRDSMRREERAWEEGVYYLDTGTSGGPPRASEGACFMVGGKEEGFEIAEPYLDTLSVDGGLLHVGPPGSGHFVKLVHNGIEFGMLQSIAEGVELLEAGDFDVDMADVFHNWSNGAVIESWLVELMEKGLRHEDQQSDAPEFEEIPHYIEDTGEVNWLVQEAFKGETPIPVISQSVMELFKSRGNQRHAPRAVALMRHGFGEHPFGEDEHIREERFTGRVRNDVRHELRDEEEMDPLRPVDRSDDG